MPTRRVVVTGLGLVTPLGCGVQFVWQRLLQGCCGVTKVRGEGYEKIPSQVAAYVPEGDAIGDLSMNKSFSKTEINTMTRPTHFAMVAAKEALDDAKWFPTQEKNKQRTGVAIGVGMPDVDYIFKTGIELRDKGYNKVSPYFIPKILLNMAAGHISIKYGFRGPNHTVSTACATGAHAIGDSFNFIQTGMADVMVCGSTEACINPISLAGYARLRALSTKYNDTPEKASRPFDANRDGFVAGEGAGILVLEELEHAKKRGAKIYSEILGYGACGDASHITSPDGKGALDSMKMAIQNCQVKPTDVQYINAHATSTPIGDEIEVAAIKQLFGSHPVAVSSTKGSIGHLQGAAGAVEAIFTVMAVNEGQFPPTINLENPFKGLDIKMVKNKAECWPKDVERRIALTNSFGLGGTNASICISSFNK